MDKIEMETTDRLNLRRKLSYGLGHVPNDLVASMWFSYLLIYLDDVVNFRPALAGYMMLIGLKILPDDF
jgi:Na+/melibiose symporter-like transporter